MQQILRNTALVIIIIGILLGVRYVSSVIRYGCANVPLDNVEGGDDCPPPFMLAARLGWLLTGDSLNPLWNRDATTVDTISWTIDKANPAITSEDDYRVYEQAIAAIVTLRNGTTRRLDLGTAYGCVGETKNEIYDGKRYFGKVNCYFALSSTTFAAFNEKNGFRIERYDESAKDGSIKTSVLVEM